jgi:maleate cis-trans isomerase
MNVVAPWLHLAYIIPHLYTDMDAYQFYRVAPEGAMLLTTGLDLKEYSLAAVEKELPVLRQRFELLAKKNVDRIALSGVPVAAALGRQRMRGILDEAQARTGVACDTDLEAHIAALRHLGASRIAIASRWPDAVIDALTQYLADAGIEVIACRSRARSLDQNKVASAIADHDLALELGREVMRAAPEAVHAAPMLEAQFDRPVLLNILSTTWAALNAYPTPLPVQPEAKWGRLLATLRQ